MKLINLAALPLFLGLFLALGSCEKNSEKKIQTDYSKSGIVMSSAQETSLTVPSSGLGSMDVFYSTTTKMLTYKVTWSGLNDSVMLMHIHGLAPVGFSTGVVQNIIVASTTLGTPGNGIFPQKTTANKYTYAKSGTISASLYVDGVVVKEQDLLNGFYYMNIHTPVNTGGEIRGQITFQ